MDHELTIGAAAEAVGVSVRTLHHWDAIGLLVPSGRTWAGYRLYDDDDIARLHRILVYRELGFPLSRIQEILEEGSPAAHLREQKALLAQRIARLQEMASAVDRMIEGETMSIENQARLFGQDWNEEYQEEAQARWGDTEAWAQSRDRFGRLTESEVTALRADAEEIEEALAHAMRDGVTPGSAEANALVERHRALISVGFDVTHARQVILAGMYVSDHRFTEHYDRREPGLAAWLNEAVRESARANGVDPENPSWD